MTIATLITVGLSYGAMGLFVFRNKLSCRNGVRFLLMHSSGYLLNIAILSGLYFTHISSYISGLISLACVAMFTFIVSKRLVFIERPVSN